MILPIVLVITVLICIVYMIVSDIQLRRLKNNNPLVENKSLKTFVYNNDPSQIHVVSFYATINGVNVASGIYEMITTQDISNNNVLLLKEVFTVKHVHNNLYQLKRLNTALPLSEDFAHIELGVPRLYHMIILSN